MKAKLRAIAVFMLMLCLSVQVAFADVVVEKSKDVIVSLESGQSMLRGSLLIGAAILAIWAISLVVIRRVRNKNVN